MIALISHEETSVDEFSLVEFLLNWARAADVDSADLASVLEYVRFTRLSHQQFHQVLGPLLDKTTLYY